MKGFGTLKRTDCPLSISGEWRNDGSIAAAAVEMETTVNEGQLIRRDGLFAASLSPPLNRKGKRRQRAPEDSDAEQRRSFKASVLFDGTIGVGGHFEDDGRLLLYCPALSAFWRWEGDWRKGALDGSASVFSVSCLPLRQTDALLQPQFFVVTFDGAFSAGLPSGEGSLSVLEVETETDGEAAREALVRGADLNELDAMWRSLSLRRLWNAKAEWKRGEPSGSSEVYLVLCTDAARHDWSGREEVGARFRLPSRSDRQQEEAELVLVRSSLGGRLVFTLLSCGL